MHVENQLFTSSFDVLVDGKPIESSALFPEWSRSDRFGFVVDEPLGLVGASMLMQLAIAEFYRIRRLEGVRPVLYPEVYVFHVGGPHGDWSMFDVWPPRKEIQLASGQPAELLNAIENQGITRLAVPQRGPGSIQLLREGGINTWADPASFLDRMKSCYVYRPEGHVVDATIEISSSDPRVQSNVFETIYPVGVATKMLDDIAHQRPVQSPGYSVTSDMVGWASRVLDRHLEVPVDTRDEHWERYRNRLDATGVRVHESYAEVSPEDALGYIAAF